MQEVLHSSWRLAQPLIDASQLSLQIANVPGLGSEASFVVKKVLSQLLPVPNPKYLDVSPAHRVCDRRGKQCKEVREGCESSSGAVFRRVLSTSVPS